MSDGKIITLSSGGKIPQIGFGTWQAPIGQVGKAVVAAVEAGYRHLDLALIYENQTEIRDALKAVIGKEFGGQKLTREDLFITSKCWNSSHQPDKVKEEFKETLSQLGLEYLDLYLIHWPVAFAPKENRPEDQHISKRQLYPAHPTIEGEVELDLDTSLVDTWNAMIDLKTLRTKDDQPMVRNIGVSNFTIEHLEGIIAEALKDPAKKDFAVPAVNQIEAHPLLLQDDLKKYCDDKNIHITAYSPLGNNSIGAALLTENDVVAKIAGEKQATPAQVLIAWAVKRGYSVIPKSVKKERIESNFQQVELDDVQYGRLNDLGKTPIRYNIPYRYKPKWDISLFDDVAEKDAKHKVKIV
ncbi:NADP-dependent oxidoreductase domain-containing protein [Mycena polygramma]|nr:NADP-dependent oxidoreductase domain-containing protein [Mycena polygramma]